MFFFTILLKNLIKKEGENDTRLKQARQKGDLGPLLQVPRQAGGRGEAMGILREMLCGYGGEE